MKNGRSVDIQAKVAAIIDKYEKEFESQHSLLGPEDVELARQEYRNLRYHVLDAHDAIDKYRAEELDGQIRNKIGISLAESIQPDDWWWTPCQEAFQGILSDISTALEEVTKPSVMWAVLRYASIVAFDLVYLAIVVVVFSVAQTKFEAVALALLVFIWNSINFCRVSLLTGVEVLNHRIVDASGEIARTLKMKVPVNLRVESQKKVRENVIELWIKFAALSIGSLIALWHLVVAVL